MTRFWAALVVPFVALASSSAFTRSAAASLLVVEKAPLRSQETKVRAALSPDELSLKLLSDGYSMLKVGSADIYFSRDVWQQEAMDRVLKQYSTLQAASQSDGSVDLSKDADLLAFCQSIAATSGCSVDEKTAVQLNAQMQY